MKAERILLYFSIIFLILLQVSFRWPLPHARITSTFGESRGDHFHDGVDLMAADTRVYPLLEGKLLYCWNKALFPFDNYPGSGNYQILVHENATQLIEKKIDTQKIASVYYHLADSEQFSAYYKVDESIGNFANTGRSYGGHIHFTIINLQNWASINSFEVLPQIEDTRSPEIKDFALLIDDKYTILRDTSKIRLTKHYPMLVHISDTIRGGERLGIYSLKVILNDKVVENVTFDSMNFSKNSLTISGKDFQNLYDQNGYYKISDIEYRAGINVFEIIASDFAGNTTKKTFTLDINLDM
jgi:hypothetical protein